MVSSAGRRQPGCLPDLLLTASDCAHRTIECAGLRALISELTEGRPGASPVRHRPGVRLAV